MAPVDHSNAFLFVNSLWVSKMELEATDEDSHKLVLHTSQWEWVSHQWQSFDEVLLKPFAWGSSPRMEIMGPTSQFLIKIPEILLLFNCWRFTPKNFSFSTWGHLALSFLLCEEDSLKVSVKKLKMYLHIFFENARLVFEKDDLGMEIFHIALPAALALTADPIASLIDTAFIGHIGPVELAAVGVSIAIFNQASRVTIFPVSSVTTSFVAEEDTYSRVSEQEESDNLENAHSVNKEMKELTAEGESRSLLQHLSSHTEGNFKMAKVEYEKKHLSSALSALIIGGMLGLLQTVFLILGAKPLLNFMGVESDSPMLTPATHYLTLRALGSPAILLSLAMQGIFRGFKDTKTPLYATVVGDVANIILDPILMFIFNMGVSGAAIAHIISQYLISIILLWKLRKRIYLLPQSIHDLQFARFLKSGSLLLLRVISTTFCVTLAASLAARLGTTPMAAFQICLQIWMATSLLNDGLAIAGQAILASAFAEKDQVKVIATAARVLQLGLIMGLVLSFTLGVGLQFSSRVFTKDIDVLRIVRIGIPFVAATQPINALAFVLDGINYGASDFAYAAISTLLVATVSIPCLFLLSNSHGFVGIWVALTIYMSLRVFAGFARIGTGSGPWRFLRVTS